MSYTTTKTVKLYTGPDTNAEAVDTIALEEHEQLVGIRSITFLIAVAGSIEPRVDIAVDLRTQTVDVYKETRTIELPDVGEAEFEFTIDATGRIRADIKTVKSGNVLACHITAKIEVELDGESVPKDARQVIAEKGVGESKSTARMIGRENRTIYHLGTEDLIYVVGVRETVSMEQGERLSDIWTAENMYALSSEDYRTIVSNDVAHLSLDRAVAIQDRLKDIVMGVYGIPVLKGWWKGVDYYLPLVCREGNPMSALTTASLDYDFWTEQLMMLPHELANCAKGGVEETHKKVIDTQEAMALQVEWSWTMRQASDE